MSFSGSRALMVYNPTAGRYPSRMLAERSIVELQKQGWQVQLEQSQDAGHITRLARQAAADDLDAFFVVGGDGSLNLAVAGLAGSRTALGILPAGTANVWAQELGLPGLSWTRWLALEESARMLANGRVISVDVGLCNGTPFLLWAGLGLDAFVVHRIEPRQRWEKHFAVAHYAAKLAWHATRWHGVRLEVEADGQILDGHYILALISNIHLYAGGLAKVSPSAFLDDGRMELWLFDGDNPLATFQQVIDLLSGQHLNSGRASQKVFTSLRIRAAEPAFVQVDGEPAAETAPLNFTIWNRALRVLVPNATPQPLLQSETQGGIVS